MTSGIEFKRTGEAISESWVLTAKHCVAEISAMSVYYSNSMLNRGTPVAADQVYGSPSGDVGPVHLSSARALASYPELTTGYAPGFEDAGTIMGYGPRAGQKTAKDLYPAEVSVTNASTDGYGARRTRQRRHRRHQPRRFRGPAVRVSGVTGATNHGDSGGPLIVDGEIVGVCSRCGRSRRRYPCRFQLRKLSNSRSWILATSGI
jgi:secreted trypsin-like serine protease